MASRAALPSQDTLRPRAQREGAPAQRPKKKGKTVKASNNFINARASEGWIDPTKSQDTAADSLVIKHEDPSSLKLEFPNCHRINLSASNLICGLSFLLPFASTLTWLNFTGCSNLTDFTGLEELETLYILNLTSCGLTELPLELATMDSLKALIISKNSLTSLPYLEDKPNLNSLIASHNQLTALPDSVSSLTALTKISASHNQLTSDGLPDLSTLPDLREVKLNDNAQLSALPQHFSAWAKGKLEILDIGKCSFSTWDALESLEAHENIQNLTLRGNPIAADPADSEAYLEYKSLAQALLPKLRILDNKRFDDAFLARKQKRKADVLEKKAANPELTGQKAQGRYYAGLGEKAATAKQERKKKKEQKADSPLLEVYGGDLPDLTPSSSQGVNDLVATEQNSIKKAKREKPVGSAGEGEGASEPVQKKGKRKRDDIAEAEVPVKRKKAKKVKPEKAPAQVGGSLSAPAAGKEVAASQSVEVVRSKGAEEGEAAKYKVLEVAKKTKRSKPGNDITALLQSKDYIELGGDLNVGGW